MFAGASAAVVAGCGGSGTAASRVPAGVRAVDVVSVSAFRQRPVAAVTSNGATVGKIVARVDRMRPVPPGSYSCPAMMAGWPRVTLRFLARVLITQDQPNGLVARDDDHIYELDGIRLREVTENSWGSEFNAVPW